MLDGRGITGVDGTFRRSSEQTIRVLRANSDLILTVLEVFKHDPLYAWESEKEKTQRVQGGIRIELNQSSSVLEKADRVLGEIRSKLRDTLSAEYTVNMLVQEARDTENLAKIYHGELSIIRLLRCEARRIDALCRLASLVLISLMGSISIVYNTQVISICTILHY
jgi:hypothetical protein